MLWSLAGKKVFEGIRLGFAVLILGSGYIFLQLMVHRKTTYFSQRFLSVKIRFYLPKSEHNKPLQRTLTFSAVKGS